MKLRRKRYHVLRRHHADVLTGTEARAYLGEHQPAALGWATSVAKCTCGWHEATIHGEAAEIEAARHQAGGKKAFAVVAAVAAAVALTGCTKTDADVAAKNISKAAEQFEVMRRIVFINGITDKYLLAIEGYCSVETSESALGGSIEVTCKVGKGKFKKSFLGLSDNVTYIVEQVDPIGVSTTRYRVIFKPEAIVPNFDRP